jgi:hypothetical protein
VSAELLWRWRNQFEDFATSLPSLLAKAHGLELNAAVRPWKAKNPDPLDATAQERWKELIHAAKLLKHDKSIEEP